MTEIKVNTVRMVDYDQVREYSFGDNISLKEKLAIGLINPTDFNKLNISSNSNMKLSNNFGSVVVKPIQDEEVPLGIIIMPISIWANQITGIENEEIIYKNIMVKVEATKEAVNDLKGLLNSIKD
jgi:formylmethanofuran dehydrogenase subunit D